MKNLFLVLFLLPFMAKVSNLRMLQAGAAKPPSGRGQGGSVRMVQLIWNCSETLIPWTPEQG